MGSVRHPSSRGPPSNKSRIDCNRSTVAWLIAVLVILIAIAVLQIGAVFYAFQYAAGLLFGGSGGGSDAVSDATPSSAVWGTYRPNLYFGVRAKTPKSPLVGLMWYDMDAPQLPEVRHDAEERDGLRSYGWLKHDGRSYGYQTLVDPGTAASKSSKRTFELRTEWIRQPDSSAGGWVARLSAHSTLPNEKRNISFIWYVATQSDDHRLTLHVPETDAAAESGTGADAELGGPPLSQRVRIDAECGSDASGGVGSFQLVFTPDAKSWTAPVVPLSALDGATANDKATAALSGVRYLGVTVPPDMTWKAKDPFTAAITSDMYATHMAQQNTYQRLNPPASDRRKPPPPPPAKRVVGQLPNRVNSGAPPHPPNLPPPDARTAQNAARAGSPQNIVYVQYFGTLPFTIDVAMIPAAVAADTQRDPNRYNHTAAELLRSPRVVTEWMTRAGTEFDARFDATFPSFRASSKPAAGGGGGGGGGSEREFAMAALSNMIGGIGYFHGSSLIKTAPPNSKSKDANSGVKSGPVSTLVSAVPSRSFFPRGFLWDEGFHQLLVGRWDPTISMEIFSHWFALVDESGWIPREQILGLEARARVPSEFQVQQPHIANPPTLFLSLLALLRRFNAQQTAAATTTAPPAASSAVEASAAEVYAFVESVFPKLQRHVNWYFKTQQSWTSAFAESWNNSTNRPVPTRDEPAPPPLSLFNSEQTERAKSKLAADSATRSVPSSFRWGGRTVDHNLASGLDDYPRAKYLIPKLPAANDRDSYVPTEGHVDLHSWMILLCRTMTQLADSLLQHNELQQKTAAGSELLESLQSRRRQLTSDRDRYDALTVHLTHELFRLHYDSESNPPQFFDYMRNLTRSAKNDNRRALNATFIRHSGYVSLFPLMLQILPLDSDALTHTLEALSSPALGLWSPYGIRSLSPADAAYGTSENYWRGAIWINCNYLTVSALHHYANANANANANSARATANAKRARELYTELRANLIRNMHSVYRKSGFLWEQYNPTDGAGQRSHPFTGWSALIVLIMSEEC